ncbi:hypothetical protein QCN29_33045 [Streptomyces sp. HNM0663]|uniref:Uncharacterized protein n=1 Tax=Streptomyces chengmaiensis TaxID=3040919 RepID=A0ABT6HXS7_9ACTN|nr:hypothetical protein [Streptomyces chengmaiensis]MDH2393509.1 hypothetical protein [Streptomyces chengmaiensis]
MAHTRNTGPAKRAEASGPRAERRRGLRREVPGLVAVLADEQDFSAMRQYRTFAFDDHTDYLKAADDLLRSLARRQRHTAVALFDPEDFADYCDATGLDPDSPVSRSRFTADVAGHTVSIRYTGEPLTALLPVLIDTAVRQATQEYATELLAGLGACADCGQDIGRAALQRASHTLMRLLDRADAGSHHLVCSVSAPDEQLLAVLHADSSAASPAAPAPDGERAAAAVDPAEAAEFAAVLAVGIALETTGGIVLRTSNADTPDRLHGWRLRQGTLIPLTAGEVFSAYCTDAATGEPLSPEPGVEYCPGFPVTSPDDPDPHR